MQPLDKVFDPRTIEPDVYALWEESGAFRSTPDGSPHERTFCMVIPPPNVTGALHLGHALNNTLQDILIRYHRMRGFNTLWQPGTDHAGIATQAVVERRIREQEGETRHDLGRDELVRRIWQWKDEYEARIISQLKLMGCSCDWERTRFTLDEGLARAVRAQFFHMFRDGLIFRGKRLVNWDTELQTAVANDEVYHETVHGSFWHVKYPVINPKPGEPEHVIIATTRPETMLGDTAVACCPNPRDRMNSAEGMLRAEMERASDKDRPAIEKQVQIIAERRETHLPLLERLAEMARDGRTIRLPLVEREIPLIADDWADPLLGSGCVKITPAHDPNDYEVGIRQGLPMINVLTPEGNIAPIIEPDPSAAPVKPGTSENAHSEAYAGLAFSGTGRDKVVADLEARGLIEKIEDHDHELGHSDRSKTPVEPYLSDQWFVRTGDHPEPQASACANTHPKSQTPACTISRTPTDTPPRSIDLSLGATLLTWTTYGTWLPDDQRGSVSRARRESGLQAIRNLPGEPYDGEDSARHANATERMVGKPIDLTPQHARTVLESLADTAERHGIGLLAVAIMRNHVHVLCQSEWHGRELLQLFQGNASRFLGRNFELGETPRWWTKSGSRRRIKGGADLTAAVEYVQKQEYPLFSWSFDRREGDGCDDASEIVEIARAEARGSGLAQAAMDVVDDGTIQVFPSRYAKSYHDWLAEKRDWCISRQLWWGHRIPVWSQPACDDRSGQDSDVHEPAAAQPWQARVTQWQDEGRVAGGMPTRDAQPRAAGDVSPSLCIGDPLGRDREIVEYLELNGFAQDPDVLDTWFSSALWPFSTLGWPDETEHLKQYFPGSVLCTSRDIITNWVARMVMFGLYSMGRVPFDRVYIHPKILDGRGETMSKSKGNGVDPVDVIHTHGADALRYTMADMCTETQDIRMPVEYICPHCGRLVDQGAAIKAETQRRKSRGEKIERKLQPADCRQVQCTHKECGKEFATQWADAPLKEELGLARETSDKFDVGRNFCNKLWNAARFALANLEGAACVRLDPAGLPPEDRWILARLSECIRRYHGCIQRFQFSASVRELREFFWDCLCDWYIELTKPRLSGDPRNDAVGRHGAAAKQVLAFCMDQVLRLWHPTMPFITERLSQHLNEIAPNRGLPGVTDLVTDGPLIAATFPPVEGYPSLEDPAIITTFADLQAATRGVREVRNQCKVPPKERVNATIVVTREHHEAFSAQAHIVRHMAGIGELRVVTESKRPPNSGTIAVSGLCIHVHDISDDEADRQRTKKALSALEKQIAGKRGKLANQKFLAHADPEIVKAERNRLNDLEQQDRDLKSHLSELGDSHGC